MFCKFATGCAAPVLFAVFSSASLLAHDTWVETNTSLLRVGDRVEIDLKLGNHGNNHRDFKLAGKVNPDSQSLEVISPAGKRLDLKPDLVDLGYAPKEGYWSAPFAAADPGHHLVLSTADQVVNHGTPQRSIRSAKTLFLVNPSLDKPKATSDVWQQARDLPFELVLLSDPVLFAGPGKEIQVRLLRKSQPVVGEVVTFVPRGTELKPDFDPAYERRTDRDGKASFTPREGGLYLIVSHLVTDEKASEYDSTKYAATLTLRVPQVCPCCDE